MDKAMDSFVIRLQRQRIDVVHYGATYEYQAMGGGRVHLSIPSCAKDRVQRLAGV